MSEDQNAGNKDKFEQVAAGLGWTAKEPRAEWSHWTRFEGKDGRQYHVSFVVDHYTVGGSPLDEFTALRCSSYQLDLNAKTESRISVGKPVERIVKEIQRRVCEPYEPIYQTMLQRIAEVKAYNQHVGSMADKAAITLGTVARGIGKGDEEVRMSYSRFGTSLEIRFYQDGVRWDRCSLPHGLHQKVLELIAAENGKQGDPAPTFQKGVSG